MKIKKWLFIGIVLLVTAAVVTSVFLSGTEDRTGMTFTASDTNRASKLFAQAPNTIEAWIKFPEDYNAAEPGGVILGNFNDTEITNSLTLEIIENGQVKFYSIAQDGSQVHIFDKVSVYTEKWMHLAVVNDCDTDTVSCYINGKMVQSLDGAIAQSQYNEVFVIGGDYRKANTGFFKGEIHSIALYSDVRTPAEIKADKKQVGMDDLITAWDLSQEPKNGVIAGMGEGYDFHKSWYTEKPTVGEYDYSFAVVGDTQTINFHYSEDFPAIYDWILENKDEKKIAYVMGMGDIVDRSAAWEWELAEKQIARMNGVVGYSLVRGNHDPSTQFNFTFNKEPYISSYGGQYDAKLENTWRKIEVCGNKYLIFTLDIGPDDDVLAWAEEIIKDHPDHNVIITTHIYLSATGERLPDGICFKWGGVNEADDMWDKLFKKYENIVMVISGHVASDYVITTRDTGENGNEVIQMLVDPQGVDGKYGPAGLVTMLYFSEGGSKVSLETYSTVRNEYFFCTNQYEFDMPVVKAD